MKNNADNTRIYTPGTVKKTPPQKNNTVLAADDDGTRIYAIDKKLPQNEGGLLQLRD